MSDVKYYKCDRADRHPDEVHIASATGGWCSCSCGGIFVEVKHINPFTPPPRRLTRTQLYKFVRSNPGGLYLCVDSSFDGMVDCVMQCKGGFEKAQHKEWTDHDMGITGAWCVRGGRDSISVYEDDEYVGYRVSNCCGSFKVAMKKITNKDLR